ncbi:MAG: TIM-barrel domain-containing protein [Kofleriaceae bacterium]
MRWLLAVGCVLVACGDNGLPAAPDVLQEGPVTIDTRTMTLSLAGAPALEMAQFLSIGTTDDVDPAHYYDPRGDDLVTLAPVTKARGLDGDWVVLDGGARMKLAPCPAGECAILDVDASEVENAVQLQIALPRGADEPLYGTGDSPARANVAGTVREMSLRIDLASDSSLNETHVPVPLVMWPRRKAAMFVADDRPGALDLGAADPTRVTATFTLPARGAFRVYLYTASITPLDLVRQYVALTTKPAVPPRWAFAPQQWRNAHDATSELLDDAQQMRTRQIPGSVMWIDNPWQTAYNSFVIDENRFAQIDDAIATLTAQGYKVVFWSTPYVGKEPELAADRADGTAKGYFVTDEGDRPFDWPWQDGPGYLVDFTRDGAKEWWRERIQRVIARGAAGFKLDFGEEVVPDIGGNIIEFRLAAGDNSSHHNRYAEGYHDAYLGAFPPGEGFLITRAGAWGEQHVNTSIWPGDLDSDFSEHGVIVDGKRSIGGLPSAIARGLGLSVSGYPFYGSDIGGFKDRPTTETLLRWAQYAALGTIMQLGGGGPSHNPWDTTQFDANAADIYKRYADLHMQLNPLLWTLAQKAGVDGTPVTVPARFVYDCECDDAMFLLGENILVAPVVTPGATTRTLTLPPGMWVERQTGAIHAGGSTITVAAPLDELPLFFAAGSLVPMYALYADTLIPATAAGVTSYSDPAFGSELRLVFTPGTTTALASLHDGTNASAGGTSAAVTGGSEYHIFTLDIDARAQTGTALANPTTITANSAPLAPTASEAALRTCAAPGCWFFDATAKRLQIRVFAPEGQTRAISID